MTFTRIGLDYFAWQDNEARQAAVDKRLEARERYGVSEGVTGMQNCEAARGENFANCVENPGDSQAPENGPKLLSTRRTCYSCGDAIEANNDDPPDVQDAMRARCRLCAMESLGIKLPNFGAFQQHDTGGGRRVIKETKTH